MARKHAEIILSIWDDVDFVALSESAQRLYFLLLSQKDLTYAGTLPMRLRRWAKLSRTTTAESVAAALAELDAARLVVCDHDTEEVLIRSFVRRDGVYKLPNLLAGAIRESFEITSPVLRAALADELRRLPAETTGPAPQLTAVALEAGATELPEQVQAALDARCGRTRRTTAAATKTAVPPAPVVEAPTVSAPPAAVVEGHAPVPLASLAPSPIPSENPSGIPSPTLSAIPSAMGQGEGSGEKGLVVPPTVTAPGLGGPPRTHAGPQTHTGTRVGADAHTREAAVRLVAENTPVTTQAVGRRLAGEVEALLAEGIAPVHVAAGLRRWAGKRLGTTFLPELVSEEMRAGHIAAASAPSSRTDDVVRAALEMGRRMAIEDDDQTEIGLMLRGIPATGAGSGPMPLRELLAAATPQVVAA